MWKRILQNLNAEPERPWQSMVDSTIVKAHHHSAGAKKRGDNDQGIGRSRGGLTSKLHVVVDEQGRPLKLLLSGGNRNDTSEAPFLLDGLELGGCYVLADKGDDSVDFVGRIEGALGTAVIPFRRTNKVQREYDKEHYKTRNQEERFFNRMKQYRRFATRYERTAKSFLAPVHFVAVFVYLAISRL